jgi:hypothetical protein
VREDSAHRVAEDAPEFAIGAFGKLQSSELPRDQLAYGTTKLAALYLLAPVRTKRGVPAFRRELVAPLAAALSLVQHAKIGTAPRWYGSCPPARPGLGTSAGGCRSRSSASRAI